MQHVTLFPVIHRGGEQLLIRCENVRVLNEAIKKLPGARWSRTYKSWYILLTENNYRLASKALAKHALIHVDSLREFLLKRSIVKSIELPKKDVGDGNFTQNEDPMPLFEPQMAQPSVVYRLSYENLQSIEKAVNHLRLKSYSYSTIRTYRAELTVFFQVLGKHAATSLTTEDVKRWLLKCAKEGLSENTLHSRINALKFFYEQVLKREKFFLDIPRPKKHLQLPNVLGERDLTRLFNAVPNKKHKAILFTAYSAGLRVSEVVGLKIRDIDSDRMQLFIEKSKGKKDRYVNLSPVLLDVLRGYMKSSNPRPTVFLFEGQVAGCEYSDRSAQKIFQVARGRAGIKKDVSFHSLRHSFATHILEKGVDIRYIKDILGHFNIKTTERYLHVRREQLINIVSPLDDIWKKGNLEW